MVLHVPTMPAVETTAALERRVARLSSLGRDEMTKLRAQLSGLEGELECVLASSVDLSRDLRLRRHTEHPPHSVETARISEENARVAEERAEERSRIASDSLRKERLRAEGKAAEIEALRVSLSLVGDELRASELRATEARALRLTSGDERVAAIDLWSRKQARLTRMCFPYVAHPIDRVRQLLSSLPRAAPEARMAWLDAPECARRTRHAPPRPHHLLQPRHARPPRGGSHFMGPRRRRYLEAASGGAARTRPAEAVGAPQMARRCARVDAAPREGTCRSPSRAIRSLEGEGGGGGGR